MSSPANSSCGYGLPHAAPCLARARHRVEAPAWPAAIVPDVNVGAFLASFFASAVEAIEMVAIVIGVGVTRGWRSSLLGAGAGFIVLLAVSIGFGTALTAIPIDDLRLVIGALLLIFGLQWLAKGIRRVAAQGFAGYHEEDVPPGHEHDGIDWTSFVITFKGVLLEGLEIAFIVISFGATSNSLTPAAIGGASALLLLTIVGAASHRAITRIPRSVLILVVGVMLSSFGSFWGVEGLKVEWPGGDGAIPALVALYSVFALAMIAVRRRAVAGLVQT